MFNSLFENGGYEKIRYNFAYHARKSFGAADMDLIEEAIQDTYLKCQERFLSGNIADTSRPLNYFLRALRNTYISYLRKQNKTNTTTRPLKESDEALQTETIEFDLQREETPEEFWERADVLAVRWAIDPHAWTMLKYMMKTGCTYQEVADLMGWSETTAWMRIKKIKEQLKTIWKQ